MKINLPIAVLAALFCFFPKITFSQNTLSDLEKRLEEATTDGDRAKICTDLANAWAKKDPDQAIHFANQAIGFAKNLRESSTQILALNLRGDAHIRKKNFAEAKNDYENAHSLLQKTPDPLLEGRTWHNLGKLAQSTGDPATAIQFYEIAFSIREKIADKAGMGATSSNLGVLFFDNSEYEKSIFYYQKAQMTNQYFIQHILKHISITILTAARIVSGCFINSRTVL